MGFYYTSDLDEGRAFAESSILQLFPDDLASDFEISTLDWYNWTMANGNLEGNYVRAWNGFLMKDEADEETWTEIMAQIVQVLDYSPYIITDMELWGGAISEPANDDTAFPYRDALWNIGFLLMVPVEEGKEVFDGVATHVDSIWPGIAKHLDGAYVNYQMESLSSDDYASIYWGSNLKRLMDLKAKYDPNNIFHSPQSVPAQ